MHPIFVAPATKTAEFAEVRQLFVEYARELNVNLCFQGFDEELQTLPGSYTPPSGRLFICQVGATTAGCVALRRFAEDTAEMKRLYVRPQFRALGLGRLLSLAVIAGAREAGYRAIVLDTLDTLTAAISLYERLGFRRVAAYYPNPLGNVVYFRLSLD